MQTSLVYSPTYTLEIKPNTLFVSPSVRGNGFKILILWLVRKLDKITTKIMLALNILPAVLVVILLSKNKTNRTKKSTKPQNQNKNGI